MSNTSNILAQNAFNLDSVGSLSSDVAGLVESRLRTVGPTTTIFYQQPLHIVKGEGTWLYDNNGRQYLDVYNNVPSLGHCHPKVVEAIYQQLKTLNTHTRYLHETMHQIRSNPSRRFGNQITIISR